MPACGSRSRELTSDRCGWSRGLSARAEVDSKNAHPGVGVRVFVREEVVDGRWREGLGTACLAIVPVSLCDTLLAAVLIRGLRPPATVLDRYAVMRVLILDRYAV